MLLDIFKTNEEKAKQLSKDTGLDPKQINQIVNATVTTMLGEIKGIFEQQQENHEDTQKALRVTYKQNTQISNKLDETNKRIENVEGEFFEGKEEKALKHTIEKKAKQIIDKKGSQITLDLNIEENYLNIYEQVDAKEKQDAQYKRDLGKCKNKILKSTLKYVGYKGNASYRDIKKRDLDRMLSYILNLKASQIEI
ncbi:hypothetical protein MN112_09585 [Staphylococcus epidermidis]|jgi:hypothetical protein|uniref:Uncharacterized protein n=1 Tax=Staphylococcus phage HS15 TaxID=3056405 RepID=A0AA49X4R8_9VIRU|nr:hypothetical protein [Staphylococcus epidermidis]WLJ26128.1 MAG: hypothetical protein [Staphylococcus phage HS15]MCG1388626.1 hypothetical protein [Staphylococcus epidermidis]MCG1560083.1 hypothetical protein [Staphylococcus epidermidis]MCG1574817.1 hypothetical protein [Staphylococcus epidermidis]MCG2325837.1 hypothetical protein [Staphylococcus epidermidis]